MSAPFQTLPAQVAATLRKEATTGHWINSLPGERTLADRLGVSRRTVRGALAILRQEGFLTTQPRLASTVAPVFARKTSGRMRVALLLPEPIEQMRHLTALWVHHLMTRLQSERNLLEVFHGRRFFGSGSSRSLERLVKENPAGCWVLGRSSLAMQQWFASAHIPAVVAGGVHPGISLPSVDLDHRALGRHAAGVLARSGHRQIVLFLGPTRQMGDAECEAGMREANVAECTTVFAEETAEKVEAAFGRIVRRHASPPGFLFANSFSYLTARSWLDQRQRSEPFPTLLTRDDEPFLSHLRPPPGRYALPPEKFAAAVHRAIRQRLTGGVAKTIRLMPEFLEK